MEISMKVPSPGESISEVEIAAWLKADGDYVYQDEDIVEVDSDKATLGIPAEASGRLIITVPEGETVQVGEEICKIDTSAEAPAEAPKAATKEETPAVKPENTENLQPKKQRNLHPRPKAMPVGTLRRPLPR